jgi:magnesium chelatase family protein
MNPCPCGYAGTAEGRCDCPPGVVERYGRRVSGPLRDRIDLWIDMPRVPSQSLVSGPAPEGTATVAARIAEARSIASARNAGRLNGRLRGRQLRATCRLDAAARARAQSLAEADVASGRGTEQLLRVARTIADLAGCSAVAPVHLDEALWFRSGSVPNPAALAS